MSTPNSSTQKLSDLEREFNRLSENGFIGDPRGKLAFAYLRVSSDEQAEKGSGLLRQLQNVAEVATKRGVKIAWDMIFADDYTGWEFEDRPELSRLRQEYRTPQRRADVVCIEHIDRLSRESHFHQGYLENELADYGMTVIYWKDYASSEVQKLSGMMSDHAQRELKERARRGTLDKARRGEIVSKRRAYGFIFVDSDTRKKVAYAICQPEALIIQEIFSRVASGDTLYAIAQDFNQRGITPPGKFKMWKSSWLAEMIRNPIYKGEMIANKWKWHKKYRVETDNGFKFVKRQTLRDESEWIVVPVPQIVDGATWQSANDMLSKNQATARRNAKHQYLLSGLLRCSCCGYIVGGKHTYSKSAKKDYWGYICSTRNYAKKDREALGIHCDQAYVDRDMLESAVWRVIDKCLLDPDQLIKSLERDLTDPRNQSTGKQIQYLEDEIARLEKEDSKLYKAYMADVFDELEYASKRKAVKERRTRLENELKRLKSTYRTREQFEAEKAELIDIVTRMRQALPDFQPSFELKKKLIKKYVDVIRLDTNAQTFTIEGKLSSVPIVSTFAIACGQAAGA